ncbi:nucleoside-diphosphate kinase [Saccharicrinis fermentans]|uniref:nucleoside-diphosphate kinase n=1 Tax=Saccharicrinis fermentans DSM 9555 = JCM 21142 TaxID=869213 RepID=W7YI04_9BACT|nr:nucleoside-diphosphate kinase [Saccharicrinis fermentans]GAF02189.1 nucleoside diphosphate kinase [Saccharicrinis fermentans DSM 9555 = JCM 21142]
MAGNKTLTIIKPYAVKNGNLGAILHKIEESGYRFAAIKTLKLDKHEAEAFYQEHKGKPFFDDLTDFMSSGPITAAILEKENAVADFRFLIGATDPNNAKEGTIRKMFATSKTQNAIHGSDSDESADRECDFFFSKRERL